MTSANDAKPQCGKISAGRLIDSPPAGGASNMALDQALFESVRADGVPTLRFYGWDQPTVSLGYFQSMSERKQHQASLKNPLVRRSTGGGAIVHDCELTYSLCLPTKDRFGVAAQDVYQTVHLAVIRAVRDLGVALSRYADLKSPQRFTEGNEPFLCFQRRTDEDLILSGYKVVGSAQRRSAGALLQHGSILLAVSKSAPELPGILDLSGKTVGVEQLKDRILGHLAEVAGIDWSVWKVPESVLARAGELEAKFRSDTWNLKRH